MCPERVAACLAVALLALSACAGPASSSGEGENGDNAVVAQSFSISSGREVADRVVAAVIDDDAGAVYELMHSTVRSATTKEEVDLGSVYAYGGAPLEAEFRMDEQGTTVDSTGAATARKYWYAVRTTRAEMGTYFMFVQVISDLNGPACAQFSIVSFTDGVPEQLR